MAKRNRQRPRPAISLDRGRVAVVNAKRSLPRVAPSLVSPSLPLFEDRRYFNPEGRDRPALTFGGSPARSSAVVNRKSSSRPDRFGKYIRSQTKGALAFVQPSRVLVCVRRGIRREVLHAFKKTGKRGQKRPRRNWSSSISCRN